MLNSSAATISSDVDLMIISVAEQLANYRLSANFNPDSNFTTNDNIFGRNEKMTILWYYQETMFPKDYDLFTDRFPRGASDNPLKDERLAAAFRPPPPPASYLCHLCYQPGHYIRYCPKAPDKTSTPYQGIRQSEGEYICHKCKRRWLSKNSFANVGQKCKKCQISVLPKRQKNRTSSFNTFSTTSEISSPNWSPGMYQENVFTF